jgi:hypothetical protein
MTTDPKALSERVASSYTKLAHAAKNLNIVSDELGKYVAFIDAALKVLNLGITVWERIRGGGDQYDPDAFWQEDLGYAKIGGKWGVALRKVEGTYRDPDQADEEQWLYSDAPRYLRLSGIEKLPELLEKLSNEATASTDQIQAKLGDVEAIAAVLNPESFPKTPKPVPESKRSRNASQPHEMAQAAREAAERLEAFGKQLYAIPKPLQEMQKEMERATNRAIEAFTVPSAESVDVRSAVKK